MGLLEEFRLRKDKGPDRFSKIKLTKKRKLFFKSFGFLICKEDKLKFRDKIIRYNNKNYITSIYFLSSNTEYKKQFVRYCKRYKIPIQRIKLIDYEVKNE
jgi:hypothetical protein